MKRFTNHANQKKHAARMALYGALAKQANKARENAHKSAPSATPSSPPTLDTSDSASLTLRLSGVTYDAMPQ
jgi:hypothetical protein